MFVPSQSCMKCNCVCSQLKQKEYSEAQIGALDCEELSGRVTYDSDLSQQAIQEFENSKSVM